MSIKNLTKITALLLSVSVIAPAIAQDSSRFINRKAEGWFWYAPEPVEEEELEPEPLPDPEPEPLTEVEVPEPPVTTAQGPDIFSSAWLRENISKYLDIAIDNPTIENVETYLYLQRLSMDKSELFANAAELAVTGNPLLDEMTRRPTSTFGGQKVDAVAGANRDHLLTEIAEKAGVFFFYDPNDQYSVEQAPLIKLLENSGFAVLAISETGEPLPGYENDFDYRADAGHAESLGVSTHPAVFLASPDGHFTSIGHGLMDLSDLNRRIIASALRENWITQEQYDKTRPLTNTDNIAMMLEQESKQASTVRASHELALTGDADDDNFVSPEQLRKFIQSKTGAIR